MITELQAIMAPCRHGAGLTTRSNWSLEYFANFSNEIWKRNLVDLYYVMYTINARRRRKFKKKCYLKSFQGS